MIKFKYEVWINGVKKGEVVVTDDSSKKAERKATKLVKDTYELGANDIIGLIIVKMEIL